MNIELRIIIRDPSFKEYAGQTFQLTLFYRLQGEY